MSGYFLERGWMDHPLFAGQEYSEREAWAWLIENAFFKDGVVNVKGNCIKVKRGQFSHSIRFIAVAWGWNLGKTQRFLNKLKKWNMIDTQTDTGQQIITICNYDKFQTKKSKSDTPNERKPIRERYGSDTNKNKDNKDNNNNPPKPPEGVSVPDWIPEQAWQDYCTHRGSKFSPKAQALAISKLERWRADGHDPGEILNESVMNGWKGLFEPKGKKNGTSTREKIGNESRQLLERIRAGETGQSAHGFD